MSSLKEEMMRVHERTDFKVNFAGITQLGEFRYTHGGSVRPGLEYHVHYTNNKQKIYMTGGSHNSSSKIIEKNGTDESMFYVYNTLIVKEKEDYPKKHRPLPVESDYRIGSFTRYFTQKANNPVDELFEISEEDYNSKNNLFRYFEIRWRISGTKKEVIVENLNTLLSQVKIRGNESLSKKLYPLQFWKPNPDSQENMQRKLGRLKHKIQVEPFQSQGSWNTIRDFMGDDAATNNFERTADNIVYDEDGNPDFGFIDGTRTDAPESGP